MWRLTQGERHVNTKLEIRVIHLQTKEHQVLSESQPPGARGAAWTRTFPKYLPRDHSQHLDLRLLASRAVRQYISVGHPTQFEALSSSSSSILIWMVRGSGSPGWSPEKKREKSGALGQCLFSSRYESIFAFYPSVWPHHGIWPVVRPDSEIVRELKQFQECKEGKIPIGAGAPREMHGPGLLQLTARLSPSALPARPSVQILQKIWK